MSNSSIALQILPQGADQETTIKAVDAVIEYIASQTDQYEVAAFETTIVGEYDELMSILNESIKIASQVHPKIFTNVKINYNGKGSVLTIEEKTTKHKH